MTSLAQPLGQNAIQHTQSQQAGLYRLVVAREVEAMEARRACSKGLGPFKDGLRMAGPHADGPCLLG